MQTIYADYNQVVKKGHLLAQIDPKIFSAQLEQAQVNSLAGKANLEKAQTTLTNTKRTLERNKTLFAKNFIAHSDLDAAKTSMQIAQADVSQAKAQVEQLESAHKTASINLKNTRIVSPVKSIVISRNVEIGQTVAASFQTPTLFSIAEDLTKMQVDINVDEADIGNVVVGQSAAFTVDAYPELSFSGKVYQVRSTPTIIYNVVTYDVVIKVIHD